MSDELELKKWWWPRVEEDICAGKTFGPGLWLEPGPKVFPAHISSSTRGHRYFELSSSLISPPFPLPHSS